MISRYEVTLNGISLESVHPEIVLVDVSYAPPEYQTESYSVAKRQGARITRRYKEKASVTIRFMVRAYEIVERQAIIQSVIRWARDGGDLRINDRPGQKLICICERFPSVESVRGWTEELEITFAAYDIPYWQDINETVITFHQDAASATYDMPSTYTPVSFIVPGNAPQAYMTTKIYIVAVNGTLWGGDFDIVNNGTGEHFISRGMAYYPNAIEGTITYEYDELGILRTFLREKYNHAGEGEEEDIRIEDRDMTGRIKGADDNWVRCGETTNIDFRYGALGTDGSDNEYFTRYACDVTFIVRGLWE